MFVILFFFSYTKCVLDCFLIGFDFFFFTSFSLICCVRCDWITRMYRCDVAWTQSAGEIPAVTGYFVVVIECYWFVRSFDWIEKRTISRDDTSFTTADHHGDDDWTVVLHSCRNGIEREHHSSSVRIDIPLLMLSTDEARAHRCTRCFLYVPA